MKKFIMSKATVAMAAAALCMSLVACDKMGKAKAGSDTLDSVTTLEEQVDSVPPKTQMPYNAEFFLNPENRAESVSAGDKKYVQTPSGLKYAIIKEGTGKSPKETDEVLVNYAGQLTDLEGTEFDSSYARNQPISFPLNRVIPGWTEGLQLMKEGAVYEFYIPANLAYGESGSNGVIPPNAPLIFQVELIKVGADAQQAPEATIQ